MYHKAYGIIETSAPTYVGASAGEETGNLNLIFRDQFTRTGIIFLNDLYELCKNRLGTQPPSAMNWREAWHPKRVVVYSKVVNQSSAVQLFHDDTFKNTPAIGGKNQGDKRPKFFSSVWHRMLPISHNQYLEIVTVFHGDGQSPTVGERTPWQHRLEGNQLQQFINSLEKKGLQLSWGEKPKK